MLILNSSLSDAWHHAPWESLKFENAPLTDSLLVARRATTSFTHNANAPEFLSARSAWIDFFPSTEFDFRAAFQPFIKAERIKRVKANTLAEGVDGFRELFVLAHGDCRGLLDAQGKAFGGLEAAALPPRVWLLACNENMAMYRLAEQLMVRGVRTVITATGALSAPEMADLIAAWLMAPVDTNVVEWLLARKRNSQSEGSAHSLTLFGEVLLDESIAAPWNAATWSMWYAPQSVGYRLPENLQAEFDHALAAIESPNLWTQTQDWFYPQVLALAERWNFTAMLRLQSRAPIANRTPSLLHALAESHYRMGEYVSMARYLSTGLGSARATGVDRSNLLSSLTNLLIDMNLPVQATKIVELHENCQFDDMGLMVRLGRKRLDWRARIALQQGQFELAIREMKSRWRQNTDPQDTYELAWLLYMQSCKDHHEIAESAEARNWAASAIERIASTDPDSLGNGSDNATYLLRALACFGWVYQDATAISEVSRWLPKIREGLTSIDPGPWAFSLAYLCLAGATPKREFESALSALTRQGYLLEAAGFCRFAKLSSRQHSFLAKFYDRRTGVAQELASIGAELKVDFTSIPDTEDVSMAIPI